MNENNFEWRNPNRLIVALVILLLIANLLSIGITYSILKVQLDKEHDNFNDLSNNYDDLLNDYQILTGDYNTLYDDYQELINDYNSVCSLIKQQILPVQYGLFAEAVRRYYMPQYLDGKTGKTFWISFAEFCRDIVLHDSRQLDSFSAVSDAFSDALKYGSETMYLCYKIMYDTFYDWLPNWEGFGLTGNELVDMNTIHQWCIDEIEYEDDDNITNEQEAFDEDFIKFSAETAYRTMGDCEDQAILDATYLESCGFETAIAILHDPSHPTLGSFYHSAIIIHIEDNSSFSSYYPSCGLWCFGSSDPYYPDYTWHFLDPTWDVLFGSEPTWLQDYGTSISSTICTVAFCDVEGIIS